MIGELVGHYRILRRIGSGGMGDVYAAEDTKLQRRVALKVLPPELAHDDERRERFKREAIATAALDHPNIVTVHSVEEANGLHFITMQLVEGRTLSEVIPKDGLPLETFFGYAVPLTEAVAAAHEHGLVHRDLKPSNVMVTDDGTVKVLDFGLARFAEPRAVVADGTTRASTAFSPGSVGDITAEGKVLGTVAYMSPEQAEGKPIDHRSDIFSLGILLYEMATGERPFVGDTPMSVMSSIVKEAPEQLTARNSNLPRHLGRIVHRALAKDVNRRHQSALDLRNELEEIQQEVASGEALPVGAIAAGASRAPATKGWAFRLAIAAALAVGGVGGYSALRFAGRPDPGPTVWTTTQLTSLSGVQTTPSISPDGEFFVYADDAGGNFDIWWRRVDGGNVLNLTPNSPADDFQPAFSPDGARIAFRSNRELGGIFLMGATGENLRPVADFGYNPAWSPDGSEIAFSTGHVLDPLNLTGGGELWVVEVESGATRLLGDGYQPHWSPNGHRIAYFFTEGGQRDIWTIAAEGGEPARVTSQASLDWNPVWSPDGRWLYFSSDRGGQRNLWRVALDERTGSVQREPEPISTSETQQGFLSLSEDGRRLVYSSTARRTNLHRIAFDPETKRVVGESQPLTSGTRQLQWFDLSPDGETIVYSLLAGGVEDLYRMRTDGSEVNRLTDDAHRDRRPRWSPDGARILFYSNRSGAYEAWTIDATGRDARQVTYRQGNPGAVWDPFWSPDGRIAFSGPGSTTMIVEADIPWAEQTPVEVPPFDDERNFRGNAWSPDGDWLAGMARGIIVYSLETGEFTSLTDSGGWPIWMGDSRHVLFRDTATQTIHIVDSRTGEAHQLLSVAPDGLGSSLAVSPDQRWIYFTHSSADNDIYLLTAGR